MMKAILVDDEYSAREILRELLNEFCPDVEVMAVYKDIQSAVVGILELEPDIVFLDIEMPNYSGYEIIDFFDEIKFQIIFVTAYEKYAIKAFELNALDYLLKPVEIKRLKEAVRRARNQNHIKNNYKDKLQGLRENLKFSEQKYSYSDKGFTNFVLIRDIVALEAQRSYTLIRLVDNKAITISKNLKTLEKEFEEFKMLKRVHRSWIINMEHLIRYSKSTLDLHLSNGLIAKTSRQYKTRIEEHFS